MNKPATSNSNSHNEKANMNAGAVIRQHSRSFSLASRLLPARYRTSVYSLYAWCRTVDDAVDEANSDADAEQILKVLEDDLDRMRHGLPVQHFASAWIQPMVAARDIETKHAKELIAGMRMDLQQFRVESESDLQSYCYHVAGTVGLMMTRLMGVQNPAADRHAIALGVAMQLTNIARDVLEDAERGRSYLPGIPDPLEADPRFVRTAVAEVLVSAENHYQVAANGFRFLSWDCRLAIRIALCLYREIGQQIRRNGYEVLRGRTVVGKLRLVWAMVATLLTLITDELRQVVFSFPNVLQELPMSDLNQAQPNSQRSTLAQAKHAVYLGLSLTSIMAAALFVMVFINPKEVSYSYLPLLYSGGSLICGVLFNRLAARCEISHSHHLVERIDNQSLQGRGNLSPVSELSPTHVLHLLRSGERELPSD